MSRRSVVFACTLFVAGVIVSSAQSGEEPKIEISSATYGSNCDKAVPGNATNVAKAECDGKRTCSFDIQHAAGTIGDQCPGLEKTFDATYLCGDEEKKGACWWCIRKNDCTVYMRVEEKLSN